MCIRGLSVGVIRPSILQGRKHFVEPNTAHFDVYCLGLLFLQLLGSLSGLVLSDGTSLAKAKLGDIPNRVDWPQDIRKVCNMQTGCCLQSKVARAGNALTSARLSTPYSCNVPRPLCVTTRRQAPMHRRRKDVRACTRRGHRGTAKSARATAGVTGAGASKRLNPQQWLRGPSRDNTTLLARRIFGSTAQALPVRPPLPVLPAVSWSSLPLGRPWAMLRVLPLSFPLPGLAVPGPFYRHMVLFTTSFPKSTVGRFGMGEIWNGKIWHNKAVPNCFHCISRYVTIFLGVIFSTLGMHTPIPMTANRNNNKDPEASQK